MTTTPAGAPSPGEEAVVARAREGDLTAFEAIMRRYNQRLFRAARSIVRDDDEAQDVLQEAYLQAFTHIASFEGRSRLSTWLTRIVIHESYRRLRLRRPTSTLDDAEHVAGDLSPETAVAHRELVAALSQAIDRIPEAFRPVFMLRVVERLDVAETAACLDIPEATVKTRLHRARRLLREDLEQAMELSTPEVHRFLGERCDRVVAGVLGRLTKEIP